MVEELNKTANAYNLSAPFTIVSAGSPNSVIQFINKCMEKVRGTCEKRIPLAKEINPFSGYNVPNDSPFLVFYSKHTSCIPAVNIDVKINKPITGHPSTHPYKLVAVIHFTFVFSASGLFGHQVAYTRYGEQWFLCNNEQVKPVSLETMLCTLKEDAQTTFSGKMLGEHILCGHETPVLIIYERVNKSDEPRQD